MRRIFNLLIGLMAVLTLGYKLINCPMCEEKFFGFSVPWFVYLAIWGFVAFSCFSEEYKNWAVRR